MTDFCLGPLLQELFLFHPALEAYLNQKEFLNTKQHQSQRAWSLTNGIDMTQVLRSFPECLQADI